MFLLSVKTKMNNENYLSDEFFKSESERIREGIRQFVNYEFIKFEKKFDVKLIQLENGVTNSIASFLLEKHPDNIYTFFN